MSLLNISNELIVIISEHLEDQNDLHALAHANRRLCYLVVPLLYQWNIKNMHGKGILQAAAHGSLSAVQRFIEKGFEVQYQLGGHHFRDHPILHAATYGHVEVVKYLLEQGSNPQFADKYHKTALHFASRNGFLSVIKVLLDQPGWKDTLKHPHFWGERVNPVQEAAFNRHREVVDYLLSKTPNEPDAVNVCLPDAAASGDTGLVIYLLLRGADINYQQFAKTASPRDVDNPWGEKKRGQTALIAAARYGRVEMVQFLLSRGADFHCQVGFSWKGPTALIMAIIHGHEQVVRALLEHHDDDDGPDFHRGFQTAIIESKPDIVRLFLSIHHDKHGQEDPHYSYERNMLAFAAKHVEGDTGLEIFKLFLDRGFDEEEALVAAVRSCRSAIVDLLLDRGVDPDVPTVKETSAVDAALGLPLDIPIIQRLRRAGAHIDPDTLDSLRLFSCMHVLELVEQFPVLPFTRKPRKKSLRYQAEC
ncbi:ankyrin repeat-containing domain protein [Aspergillus keveii]|uniref:Ankyrin repeat-containing domain protein n=1 Tax=Aspergillus keveii TaxID=714993 RepID=A0ABR4FRX2_9EURO